MYVHVSGPASSLRQDPGQESFQGLLHVTLTNHPSHYITGRLYNTRTNLNQLLYRTYRTNAFTIATAPARLAHLSDQHPSHLEFDSILPNPISNHSTMSRLKSQHRNTLNTPKL